MGFVYGAMCPMGDTPGCDALWCVRATRWVARYDGNNMTFRSRKNTRLRGYDYAQAGCYFVTVCVKDHACVLGEIRDGQVCLNDHGKIVEKCWHNLPDHYDVKLDAFVVMPNHVHGIIGITGDAPADVAPAGVASAHVGAGLRPARTHGLSEVIRGFKSFASREINQMIAEAGRFRWHRSFYDHVMRDGREHAMIREYIVHNPAQWAVDENNPDGVKASGYVTRINGIKCENC